MARTYYPHIYFEAAVPKTRDSVTMAVGERDKRPGVTSFEEYKRVALAQLADFVDGLTVDHRGRVVRFSPRLFNARTLVLIRLGKRRWPRRYRRVVRIIREYMEKMKKARGIKAREKLVLEAARELGVSRKEVKRILRRVRQKRTR